jgi:hypothetical protein
MITVVRTEKDTTQKVISSFMKRAKKYNLVQRARKTKYFGKALSHLKKKTKAINTAKFFAAKAK